MWIRAADNRLYLAVRSRTNSKIFRDNGCLTSTSSCELSSLRQVWSARLASGLRKFVTYSESNGVPFLYFGTTDQCASPTKPEKLFEITDPADPREVGSETYWNFYYRANHTQLPGAGDQRAGFNWVGPRMGKFYGEYFYRAGFSIFDVHRWRGSALEIRGPAQGSINEALAFEATPINCSASPTYAWTASGGGRVQGTGAQVSIVWPEIAGPGTKTVAVRNGGCPDVEGRATVQIEDGSLGVDGISVNPDPPRSGDKITLTALGARGERPINFRWRIRNAANELVAQGSGTDLESFEWQTQPDTTAGSFSARVTLTNAADSTGVKARAAFEIREQADEPLAVIRFQAICPFGLCLLRPGDTVRFQQEFGGAPESYEYDWDGDGRFDQRSSTPIEDHTYTSPKDDFVPRIRISSGTDRVTAEHPRPLTVEGANCCISISGPSSTTPGISGTFSAEATGCAPESRGWEWSFGDGEPITGTDRDQIRIIWNIPGRKTVKATNAACGSAEGNHVVDVLSEPKVVVGGPVTLRTDSEGTFVAQAIDCTPALTGWSWEIDGGRISGSAERDQIRIAWSDPGTKVINAQNSACGIALGSHNVEVSTPRITVSGPSSRHEDEPGTFQAQATECTPAARDWSWAVDGGQISGASNRNSIIVTWAEKGERNLEASNSACEPAKGIHPVRVRSAVSAEFTTVTEAPRVGEDVEFDGRASLGEIAHFEWDFGDGTTATGSTATHPYARASDYEISLTVSEAGCGAAAAHCRDTITQSLTVNPQPPDAPSNLEAIALPSGEIRLTWKDNSDNETNFLIERRTTGDFSQVAEAAARTTDWTTTGLAPDTTYFFRVQAKNVGGKSAFSNTASTTTPRHCPDKTLCIDDQPLDRRFEVSVHFKTALGGGLEGDAGAVPLTPLGIRRGGIMAFTDPKNPEVLVKVLDGCQINGFYWVFFTAPTTVGFELTAKDTQAGIQKAYTHADGVPTETVSDTKAFATCAFTTPEFLQPARSETPAAALAEPVEALREFVVDDQAGDNRFKVTMHFKTALGGGLEGDAKALSLESLGITKGAILSFTDRTNPEVLIKILNGCEINHHYWVFYGAATTLGFELTIEDTQTGSSKIYTNPDAHPAETVTDTRAFATCDPG